MKAGFWSLWLRSIIGLPPKVTEIPGFYVIDYMKQIGYKPSKRYLVGLKSTEKPLKAKMNGRIRAAQ